MCHIIAVDEMFFMRMYILILNLPIYTLLLMHYHAKSASEKSPQEKLYLPLFDYN